MSAASPATDRIQDYLEATEKVREARLRYAREWQMAYIRTKNTYVATQVAAEITKDELTTLRALQKIAEERMVRE